MIHEGKLITIMALLSLTLTLSCSNKSISIPMNGLMALDGGSADEGKIVFIGNDFKLGKRVNVGQSVSNFEVVDKKILIRNEYRTDMGPGYFTLLSNGEKTKINSRGTDRFFNFKKSKMTYFLSWKDAIEGAFNYEDEKFSNLFLDETPIGTAMYNDKYYLFTLDAYNDLKVRDARNLKLLKNITTKVDSNILQIGKIIYYSQGKQMIVRDLINFIKIKQLPIKIRADKLFYNSLFGFLLQNSKETYSTKTNKVYKNFPKILTFINGNLLAYKEEKKSTDLYKISSDLIVVNNTSIKGTPITDYLVYKNNIFIVTDPFKRKGIYKIDVDTMRKNNLLDGHFIVAIDSLNGTTTNDVRNQVLDEIPDDLKSNNQ